MSAFSVKDSANKFGFELFKVFITRHRNDYKNLCFSPFAVYNSLVMIKIGSQKTSESQLSSVLHMNDIKDNISMLKELQALREQIIKANHEIILSVGYLYYDSSVKLTKEYKELLKQFFAVKPKKVNFSDIQTTIKTMNSDSKEETDDVIDNIMNAEDLTKERSKVKIILTNALFFRGFWATTFTSVEKQKFRFTKNGKKFEEEIQMIKELGMYRYMQCQQLKAHIVSIPYSARDLRMIVILPMEETTDGIYLIEYLNKDLFETIMTTLQSEAKSEVNLSIPRFGLDAQKISIQRTIKQLGAIDVFDESLADLSLMCTTKTHLTKLVHRAFILVDERGAAFSKFKLKRKRMGLQSSDDNTIQFTANHPFVFIIADKITNVAVFMGYFGDSREMLEVVQESELTPKEINDLLFPSETSSKDTMSTETTSTETTPKPLN